MDPAEVMLSGFIGVAADSYRPLYSKSGFSIYNTTGSPIFYFSEKRQHLAKACNIMPLAVCPVAGILSDYFFSIQKISSSKRLAKGGGSHA